MTDRTPRLTVPALVELARTGRRLAMVTAYDAPSARLADEAGIDLLLVGDSAAMTVFGHESTLAVSMDEMLMLTRAVVRAHTRALVIADMPFGSYEVGDEEAARNAIRFVKDAGADAVKLEGAGRSLTRIRAILDAGVPVMGHTGLTPQSAALAGGYKARGRTAADAKRIADEALALEQVGCFAVVLEAIPNAVAARVSTLLKVPTIGIGAGPSCGGQVLVWHDLLGLTAGHLPQFVKPYADLSTTIREALTRYAADVRNGTFPEIERGYRMPEDELTRFEQTWSAARATTPGSRSARGR